MDIFYLAELQLQRERKKLSGALILDRAIKIRHWLDIRTRNKNVAISRWKKLAMV